jgi:hypothetical protein
MKKHNFVSWIYVIYWIYIQMKIELENCKCYVVSYDERVC